MKFYYVDYSFFIGEYEETEEKIIEAKTEKQAINKLKINWNPI